MTSLVPNEIARTRAIDFVRRLVQHWQETLGAELLGAYLIGSLAHAGFNRRYSDIDLAIVTEAGLSQDALDSLKRGRGGVRGSRLAHFSSLLMSALTSINQMLLGVGSFAG